LDKKLMMGRGQHPQKDLKNHYLSTVLLRHTKKPEEVENAGVRVLPGKNRLTRGNGGFLPFRRLLVEAEEAERRK